MKKLKLGELKVESFKTTFEQSESKTIRGGEALPTWSCYYVTTRCGADRQPVPDTIDRFFNVAMALYPAY